MTDEKEAGWWIGTGSTPYEAARDLAPDTDADHVGWISGLRELVDRPDPPMYDDVFRHDITIIYEDLPAKQWHVEIQAVENGWRAEFVGSKRV